MEDGVKMAEHGPMTDLTWNEEEKDIQDLRPFERNPRTITPRQKDALRRSILRHGYHTRIKTTHDLRVVGGHQRLEIMKELGFARIKVLVPSRPLTEEEFRDLLITDNLPFGDFDKSMLVADYTREQLVSYGMDEPMLPAPESFVQVDGHQRRKADDVPDVPAVAVSKRGDIWVCGPHRIMCGDSTMAEDVDLLTGGVATVDMIFTDPPWNVNYGDVAKDNAQNYKKRTITNDNLTPEEWKKFVDGTVAQLYRASRPGAPIYLVMSAQEWGIVDPALRAIGFHWSSTIIWAKDRLVLSRKDYHTRYEPIFYGWNAKAPRLVRLLDRKQDDVWEIPRPSSSELHPTTKPVELIERALRNSSKTNDVVLDAFSGSGSTMIACERMTRRCVTMELEPVYVDVGVKRWQEYTGKKATHAATGAAFPG